MMETQNTKHTHTHELIEWTVSAIRHRCDKRLERLQKILCKRVYYFVNVYLNKNHISETKQNYDGKPS